MSKAKPKPDPALVLANLAALVVFGGAVAWGVYVWTHPDYVPPCHEATQVKGAGQNVCGFSRLYAASRPHH